MVVQGVALQEVEGPAVALPGRASHEVTRHEFAQHARHFRAARGIPGHRAGHGADQQAACHPVVGPCGIARGLAVVEAVARGHERLRPVPEGRLLAPGKGPRHQVHRLQQRHEEPFVDRVSSRPVDAGPGQQGRTGRGPAVAAQRLPGPVTGHGNGEDGGEVLLRPIGPHVAGMAVERARELESLHRARHQVQRLPGELPYPAEVRRNARGTVRVECDQQTPVQPRAVAHPATRR